MCTFLPRTALTLTELFPNFYILTLSESYALLHHFSDLCALLYLPASNIIYNILAKVKLHHLKAIDGAYHKGRSEILVSRTIRDDLMPLWEFRIKVIIRPSE